jgi:hypothetical protein
LGFEFKRRNQSVFIDNEQVPQLGWSKEARQAQHPPAHHHMSVGQSIRPDYILDEREKAIHILSGSYASAFALIFPIEFSLLFGGGGSVSPKYLNGFSGFCFVI